MPISACHSHHKACDKPPLLNNAFMASPVTHIRRAEWASIVSTPHWQTEYSMNLGRPVNIQAKLAFPRNYAKYVKT